MESNSEESLRLLDEFVRHIEDPEQVRRRVTNNLTQYVPIETLQSILKAIEHRYGSYEKTVLKDGETWLCFGREMLRVEHRINAQGKLDYLYIFPKKTLLASLRKRLDHSASWMKCKLSILSLVGLGVPVMMIGIMWTPSMSLMEHILLFADLVCVMAFSVLAGPWVTVGTWVRNVWCGGCLVGGLLSFEAASSTRFQLVSGDTLIELFLLVMFATLSTRAILGRKVRGEALRLDFPFKTGRYLICQGGSNTLLNYHGRYAQEQRYALDIVKVNSLGMRAKGVFPTSLEGFYIFDEPLYSPCEGVVLVATNHLEDNPAPNLNGIPPAGNHVTLSVGNYRVRLAHLKQGSLLVRAGDKVERGQLLARVGHTGNSSEPHLHIDVTRHSDVAEPVPILFNGRYYVRNMIVDITKAAGGPRS